MTNHILHFCSKVSIWDKNCLDLRGTRTSNLRIHAECSYHLSYQGQNLLSPVAEYWFWRYGYFCSEVNIWNVNCARATALIFDSRTDVPVKVSSLWDEKMSRPEGKSNPQPLDSFELSGPDIRCPMALNTGSRSTSFEVCLEFLLTIVSLDLAYQISDTNPICMNQCLDVVLGIPDNILSAI